MPLKTESLSSMCEAVIDCPHSTPVWTKSGYVVLRNQNIKDGRLDLSEPSFTDEEHFKQRIRRMAPRPGDIVITREAPMGEVCKIPEGLTCCLGQRQVLLRPKADVDADYLLYALQSPFVQNQVRWNEGTGSTVSNIRIPILEKIEIPRHDQAETSIAKALGTLDSKIDLNRRINETLEAMAQAIFKSWFVDFDPVKAKMAAIEKGEDPLRAAMRAISGKTDAELDQMPREHHDQLAATAALFPDAMEESELGEIPKRWVPTAVRDVAEVVKGKSYSSKDLIDNDDVALVTLKSFERGGGFRMDGFKPYTGPYKPEQVVLPGDLIVAYTDVTQAAELIGKPAIVVGVDKYRTLVASLDVGIIRPANERVSRQFLYGLFKTDSFQSHTFAHTSGTTVLHLAKDGVPSYIFACPAPELVGIYSDAAEKMAIKKQGILDQSRSLSNLRDTILPKLLSGELAIGEVVGLADTTGVI